MKSNLLIIAISISLPFFNSYSGTISTEWINILGKSNKVNICGNRFILNSKSSLKKNFFSAKTKKGYAFTNLVAYDDYWKILKELNLKEAQKSLEDAFSKVSLWEIEMDGTTRFLGTPEKVIVSFKSTVKDCVDGAPKTIGGLCLTGTDKEKTACCMEKFTGPLIIWNYKNIKYKLDFSPDPSVSLNISNTKEVYFCQVKESFKLTD